MERQTVGVLRREQRGAQGHQEHRGSDVNTENQRPADSVDKRKAIQAGGVFDLIFS